MSDRHPAHTGLGDPEPAAELSERAGIADESAAFSNAIERDSDGDGESGAAGRDAPAANASSPAIGAGSAGEPGTTDRPAASIDLADEAAVERWADRYSVTRAQLEEAVSAVGSHAHAVQTYLRGQGGGD